MNKRVSRRQMLKALVGVTGAAGLCRALDVPFLQGIAQELDERVYLPIISGPGAETPTPTSTATRTATPTSTPTPTPKPTATDTPTPQTPIPAPTDARVVHVHSEDATSWDFATGWYGDYVNQDVINLMVDEGLKQLTDQTSVAAAWDAIIPHYSPGEGIAVKVNLNNSTWATFENNVIDAVIEPINAIIKGLKTIGVREDDVWVYDALRPIPDHFGARCLYAGVRFFGAYGPEEAGFDNTDPEAEVRFGHTSLTNRRITDVLVGTSYVINVPIVKDHATSGATLSFKNHFGSINTIIGEGQDNLHYYICPGDDSYNSRYSPLVELNRNPHIHGKTVLTLGDGLFGALRNTAESPEAWTTFEDASPNSLFLATDPVAVDCVMLDILDAEPAFHPRRPGADDYLRLAAEAGLGVFERGDPRGAGYDHIGYLKLNL